ncbi:BREX-1 system adenine-specific DNA-methyltransferase PglX [Bilifractor sp. LCP21S3_A7]|uniref:BREX-1 system adenine-specific DNA-methyltransferase PglX n=1 Tax=Bilifractor sp. LCP21S3_A7 TaxID=3438738 RepID=UPI003F8F5622
MDKTAIKNFAVWARVKLMEDIRTRLGLLGITEDGISDPLPASTNEVKYFDIGADHPVSIKGKAIRQREQLAEEIRKAGRESNYQSAYRNFIESSAYDWFNRLIAIRYMEVNEYAPLDVRLLSSVEPGKQDPDLVSTPFDGSLEYSESETQQILAWKEQHDNNKLFRFLLFKMCNRLHEVLPGIFEARDDASELLMRQSFIDKDGIIHHLVNDIPEEDWKDQVQIIGWIYQYYNSELKAEVFAKKEKVTRDELPAVTQLFTPDWIVRYMVENSLGRLWIEHLRGLNPDIDEKETADKFGWKYYLPEAKQEPEVEQQLAKIREEYAALKPEDLSCLDPCMGSGHILVYMFDVLEQIYTSVGYSEREAAKAILENNIYGLDIDDRAYQLAYFAVMMKARQYNRRILTCGIKAHVYSIQESNGITKNQLQEMGENLSPNEKAKALSQAEKLVELFHDAKEYGSILNIPEMDWDLLRRFATPKESLGQTSLNWNQEASKRLIQLIDQGEVMAKKYWVACTNPPYMTSSKADSSLYAFLKKYFFNTKADLYASFIEKCIEYIRSNGYCALLTMHSWMFIDSFKSLRKKLSNGQLVSMIHLGARAFDEISGEVVQTTTFVVRNTHCKTYFGCYCRTVDDRSQKEKEKAFLARQKLFITDQSQFDRIPNAPIAYWISENTRQNYIDNPLIGDISFVKKGLFTGQNDLFFRLWPEVEFEKIDFNLSNANQVKSCHYVPMNSGGAYRRWFGNRNYVIKFDDKYYNLISNNKGHRNPQFYFKKSASWTKIATGNFSIRIAEQGFINNDASMAIYEKTKPLELVMGILNGKVGQYYLNLVNESLNYTSGNIASVPYNTGKNEKVRNIILEITKQCISLSKEDWDSFENSWDFSTHPLIENKSGAGYADVPIDKWSYHLSDTYHSWEMNAQARFDQLKKNEEELNRIFIDIYGLQDELTPEEDDKDVTVRKADLGRDIRSLISYAIGCMFGRYSLDKEGLIYAGGDWKSVQDVYKTFLPDQDNVIPITDQKYLDDDVVERICEFLTVVYGAETLEENLDFIAKALGNKGLTSREVIRNYMLNDFFKDHCKTYSVTGSGKRPIYWLFDSGKENAFKALVYMHRWDEDTTGRVLLYAQQIQQKYETEIRAIDMMLDHITDARQKSTEEKRQEHLKKQLEELVDYEERLEHMANERIAIDLDDGVKVNYEKVQTDRNGKKYQILAPIK